MSNKIDEPTIEQLMQLIQADMYGYFFTIDSNTNLEIDFGRPDRQWRLRDKETGEEKIFTVNTAVELFNKYKVDFFKLHVELTHTVGITTASAQARVDRVKEVLGEERVQEMLDEWEEFKKNLKETANNVVRRSKIKLVGDK